MSASPRFLGGQRRTPLDRRLRREARASTTARLSDRAKLQKRLGWPVCALGVVLFVATYVASAAGVNLVAFDRHHLLGQLAGGWLAVTGLVWATR